MILGHPNTILLEELYWGAVGDANRRWTARTRSRGEEGRERISCRWAVLKSNIFSFNVETLIM
jgi:hypothetical protein